MKPQWIHNESHNESNNGTDNTTLADTLKRKWNHQRKTMLNNYAVAAWMLLPVPEVMEDTNNNHDGKHRKLLSKLVIKLLLPFKNFVGTREDYTTKKDELLDIF